MQSVVNADAAAMQSERGVADAAAAVVVVPIILGITMVAVIWYC